MVGGGCCKTREKDDAKEEDQRDANREQLRSGKKREDPTNKESGNARQQGKQNHDLFVRTLSGPKKGGEEMKKEGGRKTENL